MSPGWSAAVTIVGLVFVIAGIWCGVDAYVATVREHDELPVWPWAARKAERALALARSRRAQEPPPPPRTIEPASIPSGERFGTPTITQSPPPTLEERLEKLERRQLETDEQVAATRARVKEMTADLRRELAEQGHRLDAADTQLESLAKSTAVSGARQQLLGLILVGVGTVVMALPTLAAAF